MRTTITLDDDVVTMIKRLQEQEKKPFKRIVNDLLRSALVEKRKIPKKNTIYQTPELTAGVCRYPDLDNIAEILAVAEKEDYS